MTWNKHILLLLAGIMGTTAGGAPPEHYRNLAEDPGLRRCRAFLPTN